MYFPPIEITMLHIWHEDKPHISSEKKKSPLFSPWSEGNAKQNNRKIIKNEKGWIENSYISQFIDWITDLLNHCLFVCLFDREDVKWGIRSREPPGSRGLTGSSDAIVIESSCPSGLLISAYAVLSSPALRCLPLPRLTARHPDTKTLCAGEKKNLLFFPLLFSPSLFSSSITFLFASLCFALYILLHCPSKLYV